jgi:hypothetical protein
MLSSGSATLVLKPNTVKNQAVTITYSGDADFVPSTMTTARLK